MWSVKYDTPPKISSCWMARQFPISHAWWKAVYLSYGSVTVTVMVRVGVGMFRLGVMVRVMVIVRVRVSVRIMVMMSMVRIRIGFMVWVRLGFELGLGLGLGIGIRIGLGLGLGLPTLHGYGGEEDGHHHAPTRHAPTGPMLCCAPSALRRHLQWQPVKGVHN